MSDIWLGKLCSLSVYFCYINVERAISKETDDEFTFWAVESLDEACKLLEVGFEYVCDMDDKNLFRKRKMMTKDSHESRKNHTIEIIGVRNLPIIKKGDDLAQLVCSRAEQQGTPIEDGDIIVIAHIIVSRAEGNMVNLTTITPSEFARNLAKQCNKDLALVETVLRESKTIVRTGNGNIIAETKHGFICANAGVDRSNVPDEANVALLPERPDDSAREIRRKIKELTGKDVAVIISDTHGRPLRQGEINIAIGVAGISPIRDRRGETDLFGYILRVKRTAIADELSSAAELVIGQADEGIPVAIIRGYSYPRSEKAGAAELIRPREKDLFI